MITLIGNQARGAMAMSVGWRVRSESMPCGFCFVPYALGTKERDEFLTGCRLAVFGEDDAST